MQRAPGTSERRAQEQGEGSCEGGRAGSPRQARGESRQPAAAAAAAAPEQRRRLSKPSTPSGPEGDAGGLGQSKGGREIVWAPVGRLRSIETLSP